MIDLLLAVILLGPPAVCATLVGVCVWADGGDEK